MSEKPGQIGDWQRAVAPLLDHLIRSSRTTNFTAVARSAGIHRSTLREYLDCRVGMPLAALESVSAAVGLGIREVARVVDDPESAQLLRYLDAGDVADIAAQMASSDTASGADRNPQDRSVG
jgi:hypothetical protein